MTPLEWCRPRNAGEFLCELAARDVTLYEYWAAVDGSGKVLAHTSAGFFEYVPHAAPSRPLE